jgi:hypothetical protein
VSIDLRGRLGAINAATGHQILLAMPTALYPETLYQVSWTSMGLPVFFAGDNPGADATWSERTDPLPPYAGDEFHFETTGGSALTARSEDVNPTTTTETILEPQPAEDNQSGGSDVRMALATDGMDSPMDASASAVPAVTAESIARPAKVGIGTWEVRGHPLGTSAANVAQLDLGWYYNWSLDPLVSRSKQGTGGADFVPMFKEATDVTPDNRRDVRDSDAKYVLGFNEPDNSSQADMTVSQALKLWPKLMSTGKLLGSPAPTTNEALGEDSWLGRFMARAEKKDLDVDFIAVHYYSASDDIATFKRFLKDVHEQYDRPVWVTEWALVDWNDHDRFSQDQLAEFAHDAIQMMDNLGFVKRHAWFAAYTGGDGYHINTELFDEQNTLTTIGQTFQDLTM